MNKLFFELHNNLPRQGPGNTYYTQKAYKCLNLCPNPHILDIGCANGKQTIDLYNINPNSIITAIDNHQPFLDSLNNQIEKLKLFDKIKTENADMNNLNFKNNSFNAIWAEGSIYIIGFEKGIKQWKKLLKTKGYIAVSHISWLKDDPPNEITKFWKDNYPNIKNIQTNLNIIKNAGYNIINHFILSENAWFDDYYNPLQNNINAFITKYQNNNDALKIAKEEQLEINLYKKYSKYYGYVFYIMQKP